MLIILTQIILSMTDSIRGPQTLADFRLAKDTCVGTVCVLCLYLVLGAVLDKAHALHINHDRQCSAIDESLCSECVVFT